MDTKTKHKDIEINTHNQYNSPGLNKNDLKVDPIDQLKNWFSHAVENNVHEPEAMNLSTCSIEDPIPNSRIVLLKSIINKLGVNFYTNYNSQKGAELSKNPYAALTFHWRYPQSNDGETQRQVRIRGKVIKSPLNQSEQYFNSRSVESRLGAYASKQSTVLKGINESDDGRQLLESRLKQQFNKFGLDSNEYGNDVNIPLPEFWGGYILIPFQIEFWSGRPSRLHDRFVYNRDKQSLNDALMGYNSINPIENTDDIINLIDNLKLQWYIDRLSP